MEKSIPVFFDFGGTIVDTISITQAVFKKAFGKEFTRKQIIQMYKDASRKRMSMDMFFKYPVNPIKLLLNRRKLQKLQEEIFLEKIQLVPQAKETLEKIGKIDNLVLVIVTQNPTMAKKEYSDKVLKKLFGKNNPFDMTLSGEDKLALITDNFDAETISRSVLIGDLPNDVIVAEMLKISCFGASWGYSDESELDTLFIADEFSDLYDMILDHIEDLKEDAKKEDQLEEIDFDETEFDDLEFEELEFVEE
jgi:phosphoglycolate phosphatase-like HAD superfamily hydrolase